MDSRTTTKIRQVISSKDLKKIIRENETFLLHLIDDIENLQTTFISINSIKKRKESTGIDADPFEIWLKFVNLNYYEIEMKDAVDIMLDFGYDNRNIFRTDFVRGIPRISFIPTMMIIHRGEIFHNTQNNCYCIESIIEGLLKLNPDLVLVPD